MTTALSNVLAALPGKPRRWRLSRGQAVWRAGDPARDFIAVESGLVKIVRLGPEGVEAIVGLFGPGDSIGDTAVIERGVYPADAIVASRAAALAGIEAAPVLRAAESDARLAAALREALLAHTHALRNKIEVMTAGGVSERVATLLLLLARRFGHPAGGGVEIPIALSRTELAALVGATVETTIRVLSAWRRQGLVLSLPQGLRLTAAGLETLGRSAAAASFEDK
ncbi:MAG TPA: Crp/Fnr family transcriptional regulator [Terriglobales bacterium]|nr:Crp/Fnr family transcriptional regulator [Terriglobales bacterium]